MQSLANQGTVQATVGRRGGYCLAKPTTEISLLDIVEAVEGRTSTFRCTEIRRKGPVSVKGSLYSPICAIAEAMYRADRAWRDTLASTTIADLMSRLSTTIPPQAIALGALWFNEVLK